MEFAEVKRSILVEVVRNGYAKADELPASLTSGIESARIQRWMDKFFRAYKPEDLPRSPRLVNHFPIGADPEFAMADPLMPEQMYNANDYGLHAGLAFGMDNNGRLVELRPAPSRFALEVVASILSELRWMALLMPKLREFAWISRPYFARDGLGGHVHFGRKRLGQYREREVQILDDLAALLVRGGVFNREMSVKRVANCKQNGNYGKAGDIRLQKHGYEYRTMPTWLDNPWLAYLVLVLSKLVVHDPGLLHGIQPGVNVKRVIRNILAFYKGLDDDALIAYNALQVHGLPQQLGQDFRTAWGIGYGKEIKRPNIDYIPSSIEATAEDTQVIFSYLLSARPIIPAVPVPNWTPLQFPAGYQSALKYSQTYHRPGVGELCHNLVVNDTLPITFNPTDYRLRLQLQVPGAMYDKTMRLVRSNAHTKLGVANIEFLVSKRDEDCIQVYLGETLRSIDVLPKIKRFLLEGWLPLWKADEVTADSFPAWQKRSKQVDAPAIPVPRSRGKELKELVVDPMF